MNMGLVYIGKVSNIFEIPGADKIESVEVICGKGGKWRGVVQKNSLKIDDMCQVYLQDSIVPQTPAFSFMEKNNWRVRMLRLRGTPSEVLVTPQSIPGEIGQDITELAGVTKYEKIVPANMSGLDLGNFPTHLIPKTDEILFQKIPLVVESLQGQPFYSSVKIDGSSATIYQHNGHFGCCTRNLEKKEHDNNAVWQIAKKYNLKEKISGQNIALQFEVAGPGIQKNRLGLSEISPFLFDVYDIDNRRYFGLKELVSIATEFDFPLAQILEEGESFNVKSDDALRKYAEGKYASGQQREGVVIRPMEYTKTLEGDRVSFKVINLLYLD